MTDGLQLQAARGQGSNSNLPANISEAKADGGLRTIQFESTLTCPECGHAKTETMPPDACQWLYECERCHAVLKPEPGHCCVCCPYRTEPCPRFRRVRAQVVAAVERFQARCLSPAACAARWLKNSQTGQLRDK